MFISCRLILRQNFNPEIQDSGRSLEVELLRSNLPVAHKNNTELNNLDLNQWARKLHGKFNDFTWWGWWRAGVNSTTKTANEAYSIGTNVDPRHKFWVYSLRNKELNFVERLNGGERGLGFGHESDAGTTTALTLRNAMSVPGGISPADTTGGGSGTVKVASNLHILELGHVSWYWIPSTVR